jgi:hypothetical protein
MEIDWIGQLLKEIGIIEKMNKIMDILYRTVIKSNKIYVM